MNLCRHLWMPIVSFVLVTNSLHAQQPAKVLFVGKQPDHPYGTHMYMHTCGVLAKCLQNAGIDSVISTGWPDDPDQLEGVRSVVVYSSPAAEFLLDSPHRDQLERLLDQGVGLVTIHWASSIYQENYERLGPRWLSYLGGTWISNVGLHTGKSTLKQLEPQHPICRGWNDHEIHDEYYLNPTIDTATPLMQVSAKEQPVVVGWYFERPGGGRSFATTLGHFYRNFQQEPFRKMVVNGIVWSAGSEVPESGVDVKLSDDDLKLPPKPADK